MRIGNGPRLVVPRPGTPSRRSWNGGWRDRGQAYDEHRARERERLRKIKAATHDDAYQRHAIEAGVAERCFTPFLFVYRLLDAHGRSTGKRLTSVSHLKRSTKVKPVLACGETLHSQLSRMLKRAHKLAVREP